MSTQRARPMEQTRRVPSQACSPGGTGLQCEQHAKRRAQHRQLVPESGYAMTTSWQCQRHMCLDISRDFSKGEYLTQANSFAFS